jgi:hypothetical protein
MIADILQTACAPAPAGIPLSTPLAALSLPELRRLGDELMRAYGVGLSLRNDGLFCLWRQGNEWPLMPGARLGDAFAGAARMQKHFP